jgi:hypothetical protein
MWLGSESGQSAEDRMSCIDVRFSVAWWILFSSAYAMARTITTPDAAGVARLIQYHKTAILLALVFVLF